MINKLYIYINELKNKYIISSISNRIATGAIWGTIGTIATRSITLVLSFILARILGKDGFGEYGVIINTATTISGFVGLGIGATVTRYVASLKIREPLKAGRIIGLSTIITWISALVYGIAIIYFAPLLAEKTLAAPHLTPLLQISSISIGLGVVNSVQTSTLTGLESFRKSSALSTLTSILNSVLVVLFAWFWNIKGSIIALAICSSITVILYFIETKKELHISKITVTYKDVWKEWKILISYSLPAFLSTITVGPAIWISNAFLANQNGGYGELGIYNAALQWHTFVQFFPALISTAVLPVMSDMYYSGNKLESIKIMWKMMRITLYIVIPLAIIVSLFSKVIMSAYGTSFVEGHWTVVIIVFTTVLYSTSSHLGTFIAASGKMWIAFLINSLWGLTLIILSYQFVDFGAIGLAFARFIAYLLHFIWSLVICYKISNILTKQELIKHIKK